MSNTKPSQARVFSCLNLNLPPSPTSAPNFPLNLLRATTETGFDAEADQNFGDLDHIYGRNSISKPSSCQPQQLPRARRFPNAHSGRSKKCCLWQQICLRYRGVQIDNRLVCQSLLAHSIFSYDVSLLHLGRASSKDWET